MKAIATPRISIYTGVSELACVTKARASGYIDGAYILCWNAEMEILRDFEGGCAKITFVLFLPVR